MRFFGNNRRGKVVFLGGPFDGAEDEGFGFAHYLLAPPLPGGGDPPFYKLDTSTDPWTYVFQPHPPVD